MFTSKPVMYDISYLSIFMIFDKYVFDNQLLLINHCLMYPVSLSLFNFPMALFAVEKK